MLKSFLHNFRPFPSFPIGLIWLSTTARLSFLPASPAILWLFTGPWLLPKKAATMNSSVSTGSNKNQTPTFWRPQSSRCGEYPAMMCPLSTWHSVILQGKLISTMPCAMSSSSQQSLKGWPILLFGGKCDKLNQQWLRTKLVWHLKLNLIWTPTVNSPTLSRCLLTTWPVLCRPKQNRFPIKLSRKKLNAS